MTAGSEGLAGPQGSRQPVADQPAGVTPPSSSEPWPAWLADLTPEDRVRAIADAVAECYDDHQCQGKADHFRESAGGQHCTVGVAGDLLSRLLGEARQQGWESAFTEAADAHEKRLEAALGSGWRALRDDAAVAITAPDPYPLPGSGVTLWHPVSSFEAVQITPGCDLDAIAEWCGGKRARVQFDDGSEADGVRLLTRSGHVTATEGNWISLDRMPPAVWEPSAFPERFEPVRPVPSAGPKVTLGILRSQVSAALEACEDDGTDPADAVMAVVSPVLGEIWASRAAPVPPDGHSQAVPPEAALELLETARELLWSTGSEFPERNPNWSMARDGWLGRYRALVAEYAAAKAGKVESDREFLKRLRELPEAHRPVSLLPDGTFVEVQIKGHQTCEGYLTAGMWHGERYGFLLDKLGEDGKFVAAFPPVAGSVHLITAVPEPGSEPEQPDPWAPPGELESMRAEVTASRRLLTAQHLKIAALSEWAFSFLDGDKALAEVRAILERDFTPEADDAEPPF